jgi:hypothetical protein
MFKKDDVGRAPLDYFSWGHIDMGVVVFLLWSMVNLLPSAGVGSLIFILPFGLSIILTIVVAIVWEILENTVLIDIGLKFEGKKDSFINALFDIIFVVIGGLIMWGIKVIIVNMIMGVAGIGVFYIVGVITFVAVLIGFFIGRSMTK